MSSTYEGYFESKENVKEVRETCFRYFVKHPVYKMYTWENNTGHGYGLFVVVAKDGQRFLVMKSTDRRKERGQVKTAEY